MRSVPLVVAPLVTEHALPPLLQNSVIGDSQGLWLLVRGLTRETGVPMALEVIGTRYSVPPPSGWVFPAT
jgi:hypothetical protein